MWGNLDQSIGGNAGGGFMDETTHGIGESGGDSTAKKQRNIVPVFIKHLLTCNGETLTLRKEIVAQSVTFIARILDVEKTATKNTYNLQDDTGKILAYQWLEAGKNQEEPPMEAETHVKIIGHLRENNGKKHVLIQRIRPLSGLNELTNHHLEVLHMFITLSKGGSSGSNTMDASSKMATEDTENGQSTVGLNKEQAIVFKIIQMENESENGIDRDALKSRVPQNILSQVDSIIDFLISEGHIYSTLSDDYFKTT